MNLRSIRSASGLALVLSALLLGCSDDGPTDPDAPFPLAPFKTMAREADCADIKNDLFLLDGVMVLWHRRGNCTDNGHELALFGSTPDQVICNARNTIGGTIRFCNDPSMSALFTQIENNWDQPGYGIDPPHELEPIPL